MKLPNYQEARTRDPRPFERKTYQLDLQYRDLFQGKTYYVKTYGCQMNEHDSENIKGMLEELGFMENENYEEADLVLLNTCSIRENAHNKAFGMLGRIKHLKETKKDLVVGLCGCMAQEEKVVTKLLSDYPFVDFVVGTHNLFQLPTLLAKSATDHTREFEVWSREQDLIEEIPIHRTSPYKAFVNIIYGCDKFCTYCIVPYTRGRQRSRTKEDILKEVLELKENGYQEVTLLGQNVNAYGKDLYPSYGMEDLLENVAKTGIPRIRFVTSHPWDFTDRMIEVIGQYSNIMPSIHLPVQSGSSRILKKMGRRYTREEYLTLFHQLKKRVPNCAISTDIIVGFPGETEEDFAETLSLCQICEFDNAFTFLYSPREGTPAAKMEDEVTLSEKEKRLERLNDLVNHYFLEHNKRLVGQEVLVLVEGKSEKKGLLFGYTETNKLINVQGPEKVIGTIVKVKVTDAKTWSLDGEVVE